MGKLMAETRIDELEQRVAALEAENKRLKNLSFCCYLRIGADSLTDNETRPWLDALSKAGKGELFSCESLLPYILPEDRPITNHDTKNCVCRGCERERFRRVEAERDAALKEVERLKRVTFTCDEIDELCCECGEPRYVQTEDGEAWFWKFEGSDLPVADNLAELLLAARQLIAARANQDGGSNGR